MKKVLLVLLQTVLLLSCSSEYQENYDNNTSYNNSLEYSENKLSDFSLDKIKTFKEIELYYTPQTENFNLINIIVEKINSAQNNIYLETYIFTEKRIFEALKKAHTRGINIKVLLEKNVYKAPFLNNSRYYELENFGVNVAWSNPENYSLNHTKLLIIDDEAIVSTGNYTYSSFAYNREFFISVKDKSFVQKLENIFLNDFDGKEYLEYDDNLILSPFYTRDKFNTIISEAKKSIKIYSQTFSDDKMEQLLIARNKSGIKVEVIFPDLKTIESNTDTVNLFKEAGLQTYFIKKPKLHAKAILIDDTYLYLGSINFSYHSIDSNREIGLLIKNPEIIEKFLKIWNSDKNLN